MTSTNFATIIFTLLTILFSIRNIRLANTIKEKRQWRVVVFISLVNIFIILFFRNILDWVDSLI
jgi:tellurite resistance protein TehA-like permease